MTSYDARPYWEATLNDDDTLAGVGYPYLPRAFNRALYDAMTRAADRTLAGARLAKPLSESAVLDVGSGSGFWLEFWRARGVSSLSALELTDVAAARLRDRYPDVAVHQGDVTEPPAEQLGRFDVISAMSVMLHVKDDDLFAAALATIAALLAPGGVAVVIDPLVTRTWWGPPVGPASNSKARSLEEWRRASAEAGLAVEDVTGVTWLLAEPVDTRRPATFRLLNGYWGLVSRAIYGSERRAAAAAGVLGALDRALLRSGRYAPSTKCFALRHAS